MTQLEVKTFPAEAVVSYASLRPKLQDGDVLICSGNEIFSTMMQKATESVWSHVGFILTLPSIDRVMLLESVEPPSHRSPVKYLENYANDGKPYPGGLPVNRHQQFGAIAQAQLEKLSQFAIDQFGYCIVGVL